MSKGVDGTSRKNNWLSAQRRTGALEKKPGEASRIRCNKNIHLVGRACRNYCGMKDCFGRGEEGGSRQKGGTKIEGGRLRNEELQTDPLTREEEVRGSRGRIRKSQLIWGSFSSHLAAGGRWQFSAV